MKKYFILLAIAAVLVCSGCLDKGITPCSDSTYDIGKAYDEDECLLWAFGKVSVAYSEIAELWNERHGDLFILKGSDNVVDAINRIKEAYDNRGYWIDDRGKIRKNGEIINQKGGD